MTNEKPTQENSKRVEITDEQKKEVMDLINKYPLEEKEKEKIREALKEPCFITYTWFGEQKEGR